MLSLSRFSWNIDFISRYNGFASRFEVDKVESESLTTELNKRLPELDSLKRVLSIDAVFDKFVAFNVEYRVVF